MGKLYLCAKGPGIFTSKYLKQSKYISCINIHPPYLPEGLPPPNPSEHVVLPPILQLPDVGHGVEGHPHPGGHPVGQQDIYAVVTSG
jgi:hypothetical protein